MLVVASKFGGSVVCEGVGLCGCVVVVYPNDGDVCPSEKSCGLQRVVAGDDHFVFASGHDRFALPECFEAATYGFDVAASWVAWEQLKLGGVCGEALQVGGDHEISLVSRVPALRTAWVRSGWGAASLTPPPVEAGGVLHRGRFELPRAALQVRWAGLSSESCLPGSTWSAWNGSPCFGPCPQIQQVVAVSRTCFARRW